MRIGVLGAGQLGKMLALAGIPLGFELVLVDANADACAAGLGHFRHHAFEDEPAMDEFAAMVDVVTVESENIPVSVLEFLAARVPVYPGPRAVAVAQDRLREKEMFQQLGIPTPEYVAVDGHADIRRALDRGHDSVLVKSRRFGYDGKGQARVQDAAEAESVWQQLGEVPMIAEQIMVFQRELSIIAVRDRHGDTRFYPLAQNEHRHGILYQSSSLAEDPLQDQAREYSRRLLDALDYCGVLALELFDCDGQLYANEMAPRVHNSGHWTIEGAVTSQFENHVRAILGFPLGSTAMCGNSRMLNLVGHMPEPAQVLALPGAHWHDYGKAPRPGRKLGHVTVTGVDDETLQQNMQRLMGMLESE